MLEVLAKVALVVLWLVMITAPVRVLLGDRRRGRWDPARRYLSSPQPRVEAVGGLLSLVGATLLLVTLGTTNAAWPLSATLLVLAFVLMVSPLVLTAVAERRRHREPDGWYTPGWYDDPAGSAQQRYWDGLAWTGYLRESVPR